MNTDSSSSTTPLIGRKSREDENDIFFNAGKKFQCTLLVASIFVAITVCWNFFITIFTGEVGGWKCKTNNSSSFCQMYYNSTFYSSDELFYHRCELDRDEWIFIEPKKYSFVTEFDLTCSRADIATLISDSYYIGGFFGSLLSGIAADNVGRKPVLLLSMSLIILTSVGGSFVNNVWLLFCLNILLGAASVSCYFTLYVYQMEFVTPRYRAAFAALMQTSFPFSDMFLDLIAYFVRYWRKVKIYTAMPCVLSFIILVIIPESPRWLLSIGKKEKAIKTIDKINRFNGDSSRTTHLMSDSHRKEKNKSYKDLFRNMKVILLTICTGTLWFTIALISYALLMGTANIGGNLYLSFVLAALGNFPAYVLTPYLSNYFGRKKSTVGFLMLTGILVGFMAFHTNSLADAYYVNLAIIIVSKFFTAVAFTLVYTWTFEIFPTCLRSQGVSICVIFERIGILFVPFLTRSLHRVSKTLPFIIMSALAVFGSLAGMFLSETKDKPSRENYGDFFENKSEE